MTGIEARSPELERLDAFVGEWSFSHGNTIQGRWELCTDGATWAPDFDLTYRRV